MQRFAGPRLRAARQKSGTPKERAALEVGRSYSSVSLYEAGRVTPPAHILCALAALYGVDVREFFEEVAHAEV